MSSYLDREIIIIAAGLLIALPGIGLLITAAVQIGKGKIAQGALALIGAVMLLGLPALFLLANISQSHEMSPRHACINNLRQIDAAKDMYSLEYGGALGATITWANASMYIKDVTNHMFCPTAASYDRYFETNYTINLLGTDPTCVVSPTNYLGDPDHSLLYRP